MKIFIVCPVRSVTPEEKEFLERHVEELEELGHQVHYPPRDTNQADSNGINICRQNRKGIYQADIIHIFYNPTSTGSHFDLGMIFAYRKPIRLINDVLPTDGRKSFNNVLLTLEHLSVEGFGPPFIKEYR